MSDLASVQVDMIEKLPTPFGLVRSGVAPDHPEVKNVENDFSLLFQDNKYNAIQQQQQQQQQQQKKIKGSVEFRGNVTVGKDISLQELQSLYDVVVLAYGCESDRKVGLEGEHLRGVFSAREFVAWYNGHPDFAHMGQYVEHALGRKGDPSQASVAVIGQGNVALDCARVLAKGRKGLLDTDIASHALAVIKNGVQTTTVLGRRGHVQGAFTIKELRELTKLKDASFVVDAAELDAGTTDASLEELNGPGSRPKVRIDKLLRDAAAKTSSRPEDEKEKQVRIRFLLNPVRFIPDSADGSTVGSVICERTKLEGETGNQVAVGTGVMEEIPSNLVLVSIGYKGLQLPGMDDAIFDEDRGVVKNSNGKVDGTSNLYVSGWLKRGPSGIIGTNIACAKDTVSSIINDLEAIPENTVDGRSGLDALLSERNVQVVNWESYQRIDAAEKDSSRLRTDGQPREKFTSVNEMLNYR